MDLNYSTTPEEEKDLAQTPAEFVRALERHLKFTFNLDVAALSATAKVDNYYSLAERGENALELPWSSHNWCNPPYSDIRPWVHKAVIEATLGNITCMLIPNKTEVGYVRLVKQLADTIYELPYRLNFIRPDGTPFLTAEGKPSSPKFPVMVALFTPWGLELETRYKELDLRPY